MLALSPLDAKTIPPQIASLLLPLLFALLPAQAQAAPPTNTKSTTTVSDQVMDMRGSAARLESALQQKHRGQSQTEQRHAQRRGKGMQGKKGMGKKGMQGKKGMGKKGMGKKDMGKKDMGKRDMGKKAKAASRGRAMMGRVDNEAWSRAALPGFPGASHLYHVGSTDFFLDHETHLQFTRAQKTALNERREKALLEQATFDRKIEEAEQALWKETGTAKPKAKKIETQVRKIERLRSQQRLAFIRAVGEAARTLSKQQRQIVVGERAPTPQEDQADTEASREPSNAAAAPSAE